MKNQDSQNILIEDLNFSARAFMALKRKSIHTLQDLLRYEILNKVSSYSLYKIPDLGPISIENIAKKVHSLGYLFYDEVKLKDITNLSKDKILIESLNFSIRSYRALKQQKINTLADLLKYNEEQLKAIPNLGKKLINEITQKIYSLGYTFLEEDSKDDLEIKYIQLFSKKEKKLLELKKICEEIYLLGSISVEENLNSTYMQLFKKKEEILLREKEKILLNIKKLDIQIQEIIELLQEKENLNKKSL